MADNATPNYNLSLPEVGASKGSWGGKLNNNFTAIDSAMASSNESASEALRKADLAKVAAGLTPFDFGAVGDGVANDTAACQSAIDAAASQNVPVVWPAGVYLVDNLIPSNTEWIGAGSLKTTIRATSSALDNGYLIASRAWLTAGANYGSQPFAMSGMTIDAASARAFALVWRTFFSKLRDVRVYGATDTDFLISSDARDGTQLTESTLVNNVYENCWFGTTAALSQHNIRLVDPLAKCTDHHLINCYISGATTANCDLGAQTSGWHIDGNHFYNAPVSLITGKGNVGARITGNYMEGQTRIRTGVAGFSTTTIGPGNYFKEHVWLDFANNGSQLDQIITIGNTYGAAAELRHNFFSRDKVAISKNDVFRNPDPFRHYASDVIQNASSGVFQVEDATVAELRQSLTATFAASGYTGTEYRQKPANLYTRRSAAAGAASGPTASRPTYPAGVVENYFDTTLNKPIWWNGANWVDANGAII